MVCRSVGRGLALTGEMVSWGCACSGSQGEEPAGASGAAVAGTGESKKLGPDSLHDPSNSLVRVAWRH